MEFFCNLHVLLLLSIAYSWWTKFILTLPLYNHVMLHYNKLKQFEPLAYYFRPCCRPYHFQDPGAATGQWLLMFFAPLKWKRYGRLVQRERTGRPCSPTANSDARTSNIYHSCDLELQIKTEKSEREGLSGNARRYLPVTVPDDLRARITVCSTVEVRRAAERYVDIVRSCR